MRIRICFVITRLVNGGAQKVVLDVIEGLDKQRYDVTLVYGSFSEEEGTLVPRARRLGVRLVVIPELQREVRPWLDAAALLKLTSFFRRERFDIVHTHTSKAGLVGTLAARFAGVRPVIYSAHGHLFYRSAAIRSVSGSLLKLALFYVLRVIAEAAADKVVALTESDKAEQVALRLGPERKYVVINNGVDLSMFLEPKQQRARSLRRELGLAKVFPLVGNVGRLSGEKGQACLIEAMGIVRERFPQVKLLLVGDGHARADLESTVERLGLREAVIFAGIRDDVSDLLATMDIFVLSSLYEAMGIALVEAMASGTPAVATRVGGVPGIMRDGEEGLLVPAGDAAALAAAVCRLAQDPDAARSMARRAQERAKTDFRIETMVAEHVRLYESMQRLARRR